MCNLDRGSTNFDQSWTSVNETTTFTVMKSIHAKKLVLRATSRRGAQKADLKKLRTKHNNEVTVLTVWTCSLVSDRIDDSFIIPLTPYYLYALIYPGLSVGSKDAWSNHDSPRYYPWAQATREWSARYSAGCPHGHIGKSIRETTTADYANRCRRGGKAKQELHDKPCKSLHFPFKSSYEC